MKPIVTLTMNPAIDKSSTVDRVIAERKLRCMPPGYEPGGGGINASMSYPVSTPNPDYIVASGSLPSGVPDDLQDITLGKEPNAETQT